MNFLLNAKVAAIVALLLSMGSEPDSHGERRGLAPLRAIYRTRTVPYAQSAEGAAEVAGAWTFTRNGASRFVGAGVQSPKESDELAQHLILVERAMRRRTNPPGREISAEAFGHLFTQHGAFESGAVGLEEVWWSDELALALVIARSRDGVRIVDELVHLQLEEDGQLLAR